MKTISSGDVLSQIRRTESPFRSPWEGPKEVRFRLAFYRWIFRFPLRAIARKRKVGGGGRWAGGRIAPYGDAPGDTISQGREDWKNPLIWFHAASAGELESLWQVIRTWIFEGGDARITVFSESAIVRLTRLVTELAERRELHPETTGRVTAWGYSPWEGEWEEYLKKARPQALVTAKYEAWPELWTSLERLGIPLMIVGASDRPSLKLARSFLKALGIPLPKMVLLTSGESDVGPLRREFARARVEACGDPRWDQVAERSRRGSPRAADLVAKFGRYPRPWGILGSVWKEDLEFWGTRLALQPGTLWVVPHRVDPESLREIEESLKKAGVRSLARSSTGDPLANPCDREGVIVDEIGFLSELYASGDWAFVGGGFADGVHSTIEPALQGLPIACGPARAERFSEIGELAKSGQLQILRQGEELAHWLSRLGEATQKRSVWKENVLKRMGADRRVIRVVHEVIGGQELSGLAGDAKLEPPDPQ